MSAPFTAFDPVFFWDTIVWSPPADSSEQRGDPTLTTVASGTTQACFVEPHANTPTRSTDQGTPTASKLYNVMTATDPGVAIEWLAVWNGRNLRVQEPAERHSTVLFRTVCMLVL